MSAPSTRPLTTLVDFPAPLADAPADETRHALVRELARRPWAGLDWPALLDDLRALGRTDVPTGRLVEGHADALRILDQAGRAPVPGALYGVWASRSHATGVRATPTDGGWHLEGTLRFASGVGLLDRALLPVWLDDRTHQLLDVDVSGWRGDPDSWHTGAMVASLSLTVAVDDDAPADAAVGEPGFYLRRPGFFPGGVGVAAVWAGAAARVVDLTLTFTAGAPANPARTARLGRVRTELAVAGALLETAGRALQEGRGLGQDGRGQALSTEVRAGVARSVRTILDECRAVVGPAGLAYDAALTQAIDDLTLYVAQDNADSSAGYLGEGLTAG